MVAETENGSVSPSGALLWERLRRREPINPLHEIQILVDGRGGRVPIDDVCLSKRGWLAGGTRFFYGSERI